MPLALLLSLLLAPADRPPLLISAGDNPAEWQGGRLDAELKHSGAGSIRWEHATSERLQMVGVPTDWSQRGALRFRVHNAVATGSSFMVIIASENPATEGGDYWMAPVRLDFTGWKTITLPLRTLSAARTPRGWDQVNSLLLTASGWDQKVDPRAVVHLDQVELVDWVGPLLTDEELLTAFDLDLPALAPVKARLAAGDLPGARQA
ncbi:MAG: hypothetical protein HUU35_02615, partial [Armatimonadetes bacterium]|nr:hypothetical protein [Armatimonadota bacterium]